MDHRQLWKDLFGDTETYLDFYFGEKCKRSLVYSKYEKAELVSMAFFTPYPVMYRQKEYRCPYIVGVGTRPEYRRRGYMTMILEEGIREAKEAGAPLVFLSPADESIYRPLGFRGVYYRRVMELSGSFEMPYKARPFSVLSRQRKREVAEYANRRLAAAELDLYIRRDVKYYELLDKEVRALGGEVIVLGEGNLIRGIAVCTREEGEYEITEVICSPEHGLWAAESICAYLTKEGETVRFFDTYFLEAALPKAERVWKEEKAYLMVREAAAGVPEEMKVYINDIT